MAGSALRRDQFEPRWKAVIIGGAAGLDGKMTAARAYRLGCADDAGTLIVSLIDDVPGVSITFEAENFDHAFARAVEIGTDMADLSGHLPEGVLISLVECESLADIGVDAD